VRRQELQVKLGELTGERAKLEEQMAGIGPGESQETSGACSRLAEITDERIQLLAALEQKRGGPITVFVSYSHRDQDLRAELDKHLSILQRQGIIETWHDQKITAGVEWRGALDEHRT
jgi:hypothetical protein